MLNVLFGRLAHVLDVIGEFWYQWNDDFAIGMRFECIGFLEMLMPDYFMVINLTIDC